MLKYGIHKTNGRGSYSEQEAIYLNYQDMFVQSFKYVTLHLPNHLMAEMLCLVATTIYLFLWLV